MVKYIFKSLGNLVLLWVFTYAVVISIGIAGWPEEYSNLLLKIASLFTSVGIVIMGLACATNSWRD